MEGKKDTMDAEVQKNVNLFTEAWMYVCIHKEEALI